MSWAQLVRRARLVVAAGLLGAVCCVWAAVPQHGAGQGLLLTAGAVCVAGDVIRLAAVDVVPGASDFLMGPVKRMWLSWYASIRQLPWAEGAALAALGLEAWHPSRAWHTALLAVALLCYVLVTHLAESGAAWRVLRPQVPVLAAGLGLVVLSAGAAALPSAAGGLGSGLLRVLAAIAAIAVAALVVPVS